MSDFCHTLSSMKSSNTFCKETKSASLSARTEPSKKRALKLIEKLSKESESDLINQAVDWLIKNKSHLLAGQMELFKSK
jgi:hypothetical protein